MAKKCPRPFSFSLCCASPSCLSLQVGVRRAGPAGPQGPHVFADSQAHARALDAADGVIDGRAFGQQVWWCGGCAVARRRVPQAVVRCLCVAVPVFFLFWTVPPLCFSKVEEMARSSYGVGEPRRIKLDAKNWDGVLNASAIMH